MNTRLSKTVTILAIISLLTAGSALAQRQSGERDAQNGPPSVEERLARISAEFGLSDQQSVDMLLVLQAQEENRAALHEQTMALLGPEICAQRAEAEAAILAILDQEQTELFLQKKAERQENAERKGRRGNRRGHLDCSD